MGTSFSFQDLYGEDPQVLIIFDKYDFEEVQKGKPFCSKAQRILLKEILTRGFKKENLYITYVKNTVRFNDDNSLDVYKNPLDGKKSKGRIVILDEDVSSFKERFFNILNKHKIKAIIAFGKDVVFSIKTFNLLEKNPFGKIKFLDEDIYFFSTLNPIEFSLSFLNRTEVLNVLDEAYSSLYNIVTVDNASYVEAETFCGYLEKVLYLYKEKLIDSIGFDFETTGKEWSDPWSKLVAVSVSDRFSNHAFSCALYHPEKILSKKKKTLLVWLFSKIYKSKPSSVDEYIKLSIKLEKFYKKVYPMLEDEPYKEVFNEDEYFILNSLPELCKVLKKNLVHSFEEKVLAHEEFKQLIYPAVERLLFLIKDIEYEKKIHKVLCLLNEVLTKVPVVGHNVKFDMGWAANFCIGLKDLKVKADTFGQAVAIIGQNLGNDLKLESLCANLLGVENKWKSSFQAHPRLGQGSNKRFDRVPLNVLGPYSAADAIATDMLEQYFEKEISEKKIKYLDKEQNLAIVMFSLGEIHGFSIQQDSCQRLYEYVNESLSLLRKELLNFSVVKKFIFDRKKEMTEKEALSFEFNTNTSGAQSHNAAVLFRKEYYGLKSVSSTESGYPSVDVEALKELKNQIEKAVLSFEKDENVVFENTGEILTEDRVLVLKEAREFCENLIKTSGFAQLNNMYYKTSYDEKRKKPKDKFVAVFNLIGATKTGRLSSRFHLIPKQGGVRYLYCSAWGSGSNRKFKLEHIPGERYEPFYGNLEVCYEDGAKEIVSYKELLSRGYCKEDFGHLMD